MEKFSFSFRREAGREEKRQTAAEIFTPFPAGKKNQHRRGTMKKEIVSRAHKLPVVNVGERK